MEDDRDFDRTSICSGTESTGTNIDPSLAIQLNVGSFEVAKMLECPVCYNIVLPPILLCNGGHAVCNSCRENLRNCPTCRGAFSKVRNRFAEDFLDQCRIICKFKDGGCTVALPGRSLAEHQKVCNKRPIVCRECDREIPYNEYLEHLRVVEKLETQRAAECSTGFEIEEEEILRPAGERTSVWEPTWIHAHGHDFFCFLETSNQNWWIWVGGFATPEICDLFICSITVWNKEKETEMKYVGKIHSIRATPEDVLNSGKCLIFLDLNLKHYIYKGGIDVLVRIDTEYQSPKTRKGVVIESPITLYNGNKNLISLSREVTSRANRLIRSNVSRNNSTENDHVAIMALNDEGSIADFDMNDLDVES